MKVNSLVEAFSLSSPLLPLYKEEDEEEEEEEKEKEEEEEEEEEEEKATMTMTAMVRTIKKTQL